MLEAIEKLLALQDRDQRIKTFRAELENIPVEKKAKERLLAEAAARLDASRARARETEVAKKNLEVEVASKRDQIARYRNQQLQTRKNEEFTALAHEIEAAEKAISSLEDKELELMEEGESLRPQIEAADKAYLEDKKKIESQSVALAEKEKNLKDRIAELEASRKEALAGVDEDLLERYERLFKSKNGAAIVPLEHEICMGCHMKVTTQTVVEVNAQKAVVSCPQCGRILYPPA